MEKVDDASLVTELGKEPGGATLILAITVRGAGDKMVAMGGRP